MQLLARKRQFSLVKIYQVEKMQKMIMLAQEYITENMLKGETTANLRVVAFKNS